MLPNMKPKKVEKIPAVPMMAARSIFLNLYSRKPPIASRSPCPTSPNMAPKMKEYVMATNMVGSISL